jgi:glycosyltransferase involved in cell wall biosynthesis
MASQPVVYFYAPLKSPDHPVPSGDRTLARLWQRAWEEAGAKVLLASTLRTFDGQGNEDTQRLYQQKSQEEAGRLLRPIQTGKCWPPALWFTYHVYHKAPDYIGQAVSKASGIPYLLAEVAINTQQQQGAWAKGYQQTVTAVRQASAVFSLNPKDVPGVDAVLKKGIPHHRLLPFLEDTHLLPPCVRPIMHTRSPLRLLTVAMMRPGVKMQSYALLATALRSFKEHDITLSIVGSGEAEQEVRALFQPLAIPCTFYGSVSPARLATLYAQHDLFVWPAIGESIGMSLLEAQAHGLPVVAGYTPGVATVVEDRQTGILTSAGLVEPFRQAILEFCHSPNDISTFGQNAYNKVLRYHRMATMIPMLKNYLCPSSASFSPIQP